MATIYNSNLTRELVDVGKLQTSKDKIPDQIADKVVPVIDINPKHSRISNICRVTTGANTTSATIYTTPADKDFFIVAAAVTVIKDATSTSPYTQLTCTIDGAAVQILRIGTLTLTAEQRELSISLNVPIKVDRGTNIVVQNGTNVANITASGSVIGYLIDNVNA